jgi:predicted glycoside hydrolase/deacetylase ChbG (UPF0249 family)
VKSKAVNDSRELILNVDDFGLLPSINEAVVELLETSDGKIAVSLIPNGEAVREAIEIAEEYNLPVGVHLGLVDEKPVSSKSTVGSLIQPSGNFHRSYRSFLWNYYTGTFDPDELGREIDAQITRVLESGLNVTHLDSHQHVHLVPGLFERVLQKAKKYDIPFLRTVNEPVRVKLFRFRTLQTMAARTLSGIGKKKLGSTNIVTSDQFWGIHPPDPLNDQTTRTLLEGARPSTVTEWGLHVSTKDLRGSRRFSEERRLDCNLDFLRSESFRGTLNEFNVELVHHQEVYKF